MEYSNANTDDDVRQKVQLAVRMAYVRDALLAIRQRMAWQVVADACEASSKIIAGAATILAFASSTYSYEELAFAAGCVGTFGVTVSVFGSYAMREARERLLRLNTVLRDVQITEISDTPPGNDG